MDQDQIESRTGILCKYVQQFLQEKNKNEKELNIEVDAYEAASTIVYLYQRFADEIVRPALEDGIEGTIQNFKIISNTELAVLRVSPLQVANNSYDERRLNAELAFFIALQIMMEWNKMDVQRVNALMQEDSQIKVFLVEHAKWLYLLDEKYRYPLFSNSQVWRLFYYLVCDRIREK